MPSSEDCINARNEISQLAIQAVMMAGHDEHSAKEIVARMDYDEQVQWAEKITGPIYRGPYSPY